MVGVERGESEVVEDDEVDFGERGQQLGIGAVAAGDATSCSSLGSRRYRASSQGLFVGLL